MSESDEEVFLSHAAEKITTSEPHNYSYRNPTQVELQNMVR